MAPQSRHDVDNGNQALGVSSCLRCGRRSVATTLRMPLSERTSSADATTIHRYYFRLPFDIDRPTSRPTTLTTHWLINAVSLLNRASATDAVAAAAASAADVTIAMATMSMHVALQSTET